MCARKKQIHHSDVFNFKTLLLTKILNWYCFLLWKSCLVWIRGEICTLPMKRDQMVLNQFDVWCRRTIMDFSTVILIMESYFIRKQRFEVKLVLMIDLFLTNMQLLTSQDDNWWTGVVWITCGLLWCFISCLDSHSDGTHSLQRIHWWASDAALNYE